MSMYDTFETSADLERDGVWIDYGDFRVKIAHAGGSNKKYLNLAEAKLKPLRRAIEAGSIDRARSDKIMMEIYAKTIILGWQSQGKDDDGKDTWLDGIEGRDGELMEINEANITATFIALPKLFQDLQEMSSGIANFRTAELEDDSKNS